MTSAYNTDQVQDIATAQFLKGMAYAATLTKYQKASGRIRKEVATLALLNEQRRAPNKTFPRGLQGVPVGVQNPHRLASADPVRAVDSMPLRDRLALVACGVVAWFVILFYMMGY